MLTSMSAIIVIICKKIKKGVVLDTKGHIIAEKMLTSRSAIIFIICKKDGVVHDTKGQMIVEKDADFEVNCQRLFL